MTTHTVTFTMEFPQGQGDDEIEVSVEITATGSYARGNLYGKPENCYPDDGEVEELTFVPQVELTEAQLDKVNEKALELLQEAADEACSYDYEDEEYGD